MSMRCLSLVALLLVLGLPFGVAVAQEAEAEVALACSDCHTGYETFVHNPHAVGSLEDGAVPAGICASCHEGALEHAETGDPEMVTVPRGFAGSETCLGCHDVTTPEMSRAAGVHANSSAVNCLTCHSIHHSEQLAPHLLAKKQIVLCASCHSNKTSSLRNKPFEHRIGRGGMECSSCHDPHARKSGDKPVKTTRSAELACVECHADKRGPFVFPHVAAEGGDCMSCHQLHGSNNPMQLKRANVFQLCLECHSPIGADTLGSQPPAFHDINNPRFRNCTTCHVAVHGSNRSPVLLK